MIQVTNVSLNFGERVLLDNVTFSLKPGEKVGLVGRNGCGKSTLLKILAKEMRPDTGQIDIPSEYKVGYLAQSIEFDDSKSPREVCSMAFSDINKIESELDRVQEQLETSNDPEEQLKLSEELSHLIEQLQVVGTDNMDEEVEKVLKGMGFRPEQFDEPSAKLSGGWKMRVELSRLLLIKPDLLLLDEPTNHLDIESIIWFEDHLQSYLGTVVIVSHDQHVLTNVTTRTLEVTPYNLFDIALPYEKAMVAKQETLDVMMAQQKNQQRVIAHKERLIDKFKAKAGKAKFAKSLQSEINRMDVIEVDAQTDKSMRLAFTEGVRVGRIVYETKNMVKAYEDHTVIKDLNVKIERGERIAFVGQNGQGKTTLAKILAEKLENTSGDVDRGNNIQLGYYAQDHTDTLDGKKTILDTMALHAPGETTGRHRNILGSFLFEGDEVGKKVSVLSGGERARLSFACMVVDPTNVLIMDEPTNHLDIASKNILKQTLAMFKGTLIVVSHDLEFLDGLTTHTLEFRDGKIKKHLYGIGEFLNVRKMENMREVEKATVVEPSKTKTSEVKQTSSAEDQKARNKLTKQLKSVEQQIEKIEQKRARLTETMGASGFYESPDAQTTLARYEQLGKELDEKMQEWELVAEKLG